jgi:beta-glucosidase
MREVYLKPFEHCFKDGGAMSVMAAYNSWEGVPCSANERLLTEILRGEWGFEGFVVSDYGGVEGVCGAHKLVDTDWKAHALCLKAGLDINLPFNSFEKLKTAYDEGWITEEDIDRAVLRLLTAKFSVGLFDRPFADPEAAGRLVRCAEHKQVALESARESMVLLKNEHICFNCTCNALQTACAFTSCKVSFVCTCLNLFELLIRKVRLIVKKSMVVLI